MIPADRLESAAIRDVTLRDGLQLTSKLYPTFAKVELVRTLIELGFEDIEVGSFARPDLVPSVADTAELLRRLTPAELARAWVWVATPRHLAVALDLGITRSQYCVSASESHNQANLGRSRSVSLDGFPRASDMTQSIGGVLELCLATAFSCPFEGPTDPERVLAMVTDQRAAGADGVVLCDTLGEARPQQVHDLVTGVREVRPQLRVVFHGHDTWGSGVANSVAAIAAGAEMVDGALGGLGGCPFAPGASGNVATEDLAHALRPSGLSAYAIDRLARTARRLLCELDEPVRSHVAVVAGLGRDHTQS